MFFMKKNNHNFIWGTLVGGASVVALGTVCVMSNKVLRKEATRKLMKAKYMCKDLLQYVR